MNLVNVIRDYLISLFLGVFAFSVFLIIMLYVSVFDLSKLYADPPPPPPYWTIQEGCSFYDELDGGSSVLDLPLEECLFLAELYTSTNGSMRNQNDGWFDGWGTPDHFNYELCSWFGIECGGDNISIISLSSNNLSGTIPNEIGDLEMLTELYLSGNNITGTLPSFDNLFDLQYIDLSYNNITSELPDSWGDNFSSIEYIDLSNNNIFGSMPDSWGQMGGLIYLDLSNNDINGDLSADWDGMGSIQYMDLSFNDIQGEIPESWFYNLWNLHYLDLSDNELGGELLDDEYIWEYIQILDLRNNNFVGNLPEFWGDKASLERLLLSSNGFDGGLPESWGDLFSLTILDLGFNDIDGTLPDYWSNMSSIHTFYLNHNQITGSLPESWSGLSNLENVFLNSNQIGGELPESWSDITSLTRIDLSFNNIGGELPSSWSSLLNLQQLAMNSNNIGGELPSSWGSLVNLGSLQLRYNDLSGTLPESWSGMINLGWVELDGNNFDGELPSSWESLTGMNFFSMNENNLGGELPDSWSGWISLNTFRIADNYIEGLVPSSWISSWNSDIFASLDFSDNCMNTDTQLYTAGELTWLNTYASGRDNQNDCSFQDLAIEKTVLSTGFDNDNAYVVYNLHYINNGPDNASDVIVQDILPVGFEVIEASDSYTSGFVQTQGKTYFTGGDVCYEDFYDDTSGEYYAGIRGILEFLFMDPEVLGIPIRGGDPVPGDNFDEQLVEFGSGVGAPYNGSVGEWGSWFTDDLMPLFGTDLEGFYSSVVLNDFYGGQSMEDVHPDCGIGEVLGYYILDFDIGAVNNGVSGNIIITGYISGIGVGESVYNTGIITGFNIDPDLSNNMSVVSFSMFETSEGGSGNDGGGDSSITLGVEAGNIGCAYSGFSLGGVVASTGQQVISSGSLEEWICEDLKGSGTDSVSVVIGSSITNGVDTIPDANVRMRASLNTGNTTCAGAMNLTTGFTSIASSVDLIWKSEASDICVYVFATEMEIIIPGQFSVGQYTGNIVITLPE